MQNQVKDQLDKIMELVEGKLPEGDYLEISNALKEVYTITTKHSKDTYDDDAFVFTSTDVPFRFYTPREQRMTPCSFRLTIEEQRTVIFGRLQADFDYHSEYAFANIARLKKDIETRSIEKKANFLEIKQINSTLKENLTDEVFWDLRYKLDNLKKRRKEILAADREDNNRMYDMKDSLIGLKDGLDARKQTLENSLL
jgi:hypothetical protein